jgi:hypothetical protein
MDFEGSEIFSNAATSAMCAGGASKKKPGIAQVNRASYSAGKPSGFFFRRSKVQRKARSGLLGGSAYKGLQCRSGSQQLPRDRRAHIQSESNNFNDLGPGFGTAYHHWSIGDPLNKISGRTATIPRSTDFPLPEWQLKQMPTGKKGEKNSRIGLFQ